MNSDQELKFKVFLNDAPQKMLKILVNIIIGLVIMGTLVQIYGFYFVDYAKSIFHSDFNSIVDLFDLNHEANFPTWFSSFDLLMAAFFLAGIAMIKKFRGDSDIFYWKEISFVFMLLSIDEICCIHEMFNFHFFKGFSPIGVLHFTWVIFGSIFVIFFILLNLKFLFNLPPKTRNLFILAGAVYVSGALGLEMAAGDLISLYGGSIITTMFSVVEETCEMIGIAIFNYALFSYLISCLEISKIFENDYRPIISSTTDDSEILNPL